MAQPRALLNMCFDTICKNADLFCDASYQRPLRKSQFYLVPIGGLDENKCCLLAAKLQVNLMEKTMALLRLLQLHFPIGFKGDELEKMCALINLFLSKQLLQLTLPKCQVTRGVDFIGTWYSFFTHSHYFGMCHSHIFPSNSNEKFYYVLFFKIIFVMHASLWVLFRSMMIISSGREYTHYKDEYTHENKTDHHQHVSI